MQTDLVQMIHLEPVLPIDVPDVLKSIKKTKDLRTSTVYKTYEKHIEAITSQLIFEPRRDTAHVHTQRSIRIASWNIQRGIQIDGIKKFIAHNELLKSADVFLLNEVDIGMARSGNRNIAQELAHFLGFSFVFGNSYLCLDNGNSRDGNPREKIHTAFMAMQLYRAFLFAEQKIFLFPSFLINLSIVKNGLGINAHSWQKLILLVEYCQLLQFI